MGNYNSKYTGSQIDDILDKATGLPTYSPEYAGKVLTVGASNNLSWQTLIDTSNAHHGDFLKYDAHDGFIWAEVIDTSSAHNGDYLSYNTDDDVFVWESGPIDTFSANDGDFLRYDGNNGNLYWDNIFDTSSANNGDVLKYSTMSGVHWAADALDTSQIMDGSLLIYRDDAIDWLQAGSEGQILMLTGDNGDELPTWADIPIPEYTYEDQGKVLAVDDQGSLAFMSISEAQNIYDTYNNY